MSESGCQYSDWTASFNVERLHVTQLIYQTGDTLISSHFYLEIQGNLSQ